MKTGLGRFCIDMTIALAGWNAGGPGKALVVSSALLGTISGSSIANTLTDGVFTILGTDLLAALYFFQRHRRIKRDGRYNKPKEPVPA
jgi:TRAP-type C4-dicarboxylate transport system permease large subunit